MTLTCSPVWRFQRRMVESREEEAAVVPDGLTSTEMTPNEWPSSVCISASSSSPSPPHCHTFTRSSNPPVTTYFCSLATSHTHTQTNRKQFTIMDTCHCIIMIKNHISDTSLQSLSPLMPQFHLGSHKHGMAITEMSQRYPVLTLLISIISTPFNLFLYSSISFSHTKTGLPLYLILFLHLQNTFLSNTCQD